MRISFSLLTLLVVLAKKWTPADDIGGIHKAAELNDASEIEKAIANGADINLPGPGGRTPLFQAVLGGHEISVRTLLKHGGDPNIPEKSGFTVMHGAAFRGRANLIKLLADQGVPINERHTDGIAPIHRACWGDTEDDTATVAALLEVGVPPDTMAAPDCKEKDLCQLTPAEMARKHNNEATATLLEEWMSKGKPRKKEKAVPVPFPKKSPPPPPKTKPPPPPPVETKPAKATKASKAGGGGGDDLASQLAASEAKVASLTAQVAALQAQVDGCEDRGLRCEALEVKVRQAIKAFDAPPARKKDEL